MRFTRSAMPECSRADGDAGRTADLAARALFSATEMASPNRSSRQSSGEAVPRRSMRSIGSGISAAFAEQVRRAGRRSLSWMRTRTAMPEVFEDVTFADGRHVGRMRGERGCGSSAWPGTGRKSILSWCAAQGRTRVRYGGRPGGLRRVTRSEQRGEPACGSTRGGTSM